MSTSSIRERPTSHYQNEKSSVTESSSSSGHQKHDSEQIEHVEDGGTAVDSSTSSSENVKFYPNQWSRYRSFLREPAAEFFGTMMIIIFGNGVNCQVTLTGSTAVRAAAAGVSAMSFHEQESVVTMTIIRITSPSTSAGPSVRHLVSGSLGESQVDTSTLR
jgi:hypothetical protein